MLSEAKMTRKKESALNMRDQSPKKKRSENTPQKALAQILIQIIQPVTVRAHSISTAHANCTESRLFKATVSAVCYNFHQFIIEQLLEIG